MNKNLYKQTTQLPVVKLIYSCSDVGPQYSEHFGTGRCWNVNNLKAIKNGMWKACFHLYPNCTCHYCFSLYWGVCYSEFHYSEVPLY